MESQIFLTMTSNPYWDEIVEQLLPGKMSQDRLDIVARVYRANYETSKISFLKTSFGQGRCLGTCH
jgi:hypothetical protein